MATPRLCKIEGCGKKHFTVPGEPERYFRDVVMAYDGTECLTWPFGRGGNGYAMLGGKYIHRRACEERHGPPPTPKHEAAHSCGNGHLACVTKRHLSWKTTSQNQMDRVTHGTSNRGVRSAAAKLNEIDVREIRAMRGKMSQYAIAAQFGVTRANVSAIHLGRNWAWLE